MKYLGIIGGLALTLAVAGNVQIAWADCEERLDNNMYRCEVTSQFAPDMPFEICARFNSDTPVLGDFDLEIEGETTLGCSCETKNKKKFKQSNKFLCVGPDDDNVSESDGAVAVGGKATSKGKKIKKGQIVFEDGESAIYTCKLDPTCEPPI